MVNSRLLTHVKIDKNPSTVPSITDLQAFPATSRRERKFHGAIKFLYKHRDCIENKDKCQYITNFKCHLKWLLIVIKVTLVLRLKLMYITDTSVSNVSNHVMQLESAKVTGAVANKQIWQKKCWSKGIVPTSCSLH
jgi:hypothetical protein